MKNDVELLFRELASNDTNNVPIESIQLRTLDEVPDKNGAKDVNVFAIRTEGKRIPGREIVQYLSIGEFLIFRLPKWPNRFFAFE